MLSTEAVGRLAVPAMFLVNIRLFLPGETSETSAIFVLTTKTTKPRPRVFSINASIICNFAVLLTSSVQYSIQ